MPWEVACHGNRLREASASLLLIAALFVFSPLMIIANDPALRAGFEKKANALAADLSPADVVRIWTELYGRDTLQASTLTTARLRNGQTRQEWGERTQAALQEIGYQHMGGEIVEEKVTGEVATVTLKARIAAVDGVSTQREISIR